eukprot:171216-Hanusia_phi.AAC.4
MAFERTWVETKIHLHPFVHKHDIHEEFYPGGNNNRNGTEAFQQHQTIPVFKFLHDIVTALIPV